MRTFQHKMKTLRRSFITSSSLNYITTESPGFFPATAGGKEDYTNKNNFCVLLLVKRFASQATRAKVTMRTPHAFGQVRGVASNTGGAANLRQQPDYNFNKKNTNTITSLDSQATSIINSYFYSINNSAEFSISADSSDIIQNVRSENKGSLVFPPFSSKTRLRMIKEESPNYNSNPNATMTKSPLVTEISKGNIQRRIFISKLSFNHSNSRHLVTIKLFYYIGSAEIPSYGVAPKKPATDKSQGAIFSTTRDKNKGGPYGENASMNRAFFVDGQSPVGKTLWQGKTPFATPFCPSPTEKLPEEINSHIKTIRDIIEKLYNKEVSLVITRTYYPYINSYILAQYLTHNAKTNTFVRFQGDIFARAKNALDSNSELRAPIVNSISQPISAINSNIAPANQQGEPFVVDVGISSPSFSGKKPGMAAYITGIKVQLSGRLTTEHVVPRITVKSKVLGSFLSETNNHKINVNLNSSTYPFSYVTDAAIAHEQNAYTVRENNKVLHPSEENKQNLTVMSNHKRTPQKGELVINNINVNKASPYPVSSFDDAIIPSISPISSSEAIITRVKQSIIIYNTSNIEYAKVTTKNRLGSFTIKV